MKFSTRAEYGLKAMVNLAAAFPKQKSVSQISKKEKISSKYLERLMGKLRRNNLVISQKGKSGGYVLAKKPESIKIGEIVETLEGPINPRGCRFCRVAKKCSASLVWNKVEEQIKKTLYDIKLKKLI